MDESSVSGKKMTSAEREELLRKCWMTHDAMWFFQALQECGIETTNKMNKAAVRSMAAIEVKRVAKALGIEKVQTFADLRRLIDGGSDLIKARFMNFRISYPAEGVVRWEFDSCFAYDGVSKLGVIDRYECGIFERPEGWFDALGLTYTVTPQIKGCMMHEQGHCFREFVFDIPS
jgi:hypothetical protein